MSQHKADGEMLLLLSLNLEQALSHEDWATANELLSSRDQTLSSAVAIEPGLAAEIACVEDRILLMLRDRIAETTVDMRNLSAALRLASAYNRTQHGSHISLAG
jgi:hypothetical protein